MSTTKKQFNVYLPPELIKRLKHVAVDRGVHLSPLVEEIFREFLAQQEQDSKGTTG